MKTIVKFFKDVAEEMKKVSWPPKEEVISSSWVVIVFIIILSIILGIVDFISSTIVGLILK
ncbi:MAG: preprotein translocase subunit SecE [Brevinematales bacterium]|nr:preprotein translocase subunit SecE [Brevinematales bacterium]